MRHLHDVDRECISQWEGEVTSASHICHDRTVVVKRMLVTITTHTRDV